jgi:hypothetical protein
MTQIVFFDVPLSSGTSPAAINMAGEVTGSYTDVSGNSHGFLRKCDGSIVVFDVPNANNTIPVATDQRVQVTGWYTDASGAGG